MPTRTEPRWSGYRSPGFFDEMLVGGRARDACTGVVRYLASLGAELTADLQDAPWHQVRVLLRLSRYAAEVPGAGTPGAPDDLRSAEAAALLQRHREASESAAAVAAAARTPRIAPATAYALGVLHADQRHEVEAARFAFSRLWQQPAPPVPTQGARGE